MKPARLLTENDVEELDIDTLIDRAFAEDLITNAELNEPDCGTDFEIRQRIEANLNRRRGRLS